jgi:succinate dehydrogenase/fumarate reductase flavoprotein subunit
MESKESRETRKDQESTIGLNRRDFLRGAAFAGLGAVTASALQGCAPKGVGTTTGGGDGTAITGDAENLQTANDWQTVAGARWRKAPDPLPGEQIEDGGIFDIVVLGGGQSGTWTAVSGTNNGATVAVVEILQEGDFIYVGGEVGVVNSQWAIAHGAPEIDEVELLNEIYRRNAGRSNQGLIRQYVQQSGSIMDRVLAELNEPEWLEANVHVNGKDRTDAMILDPSGYKFWPGTIMFRGPEVVEAPNAADLNWGPKIVTFHRNKAIDRGAQWIWGHEAIYLEKDGEKVVAAIVKEVATNTYKRLTATKGIVIALGDFNANEDMLRDINDEYRHLAESYGNIDAAVAGSWMGIRDGAGLKLGVWAGGHVEVGPHAGMVTNLATAEGIWGPGTLMLNQLGKRFCDEVAGGAEGPGYQGPRQPRGALVAFTDANWETVTKKMPPCHNAIDQTYGLPYQLTIGAVEEMMASIKPGDTNGAGKGVFCASTLEELLELIGVYDAGQQKTALASIERYNELAAAGRDSDYGTDARILQAIDTPPFYAVIGSNEILQPGLCQATGLDVNDEHQVLDSQNLPIEGLYVVGNSCGNRFAVHYSTPLAGMSVAYCLTEGNLVGEMLAKK